MKYYQPTQIIFGKGCLEELGKLTKPYGKSCCLVTTENVPPLRATFDRVKEILNAAGIHCLHFDQVQADPKTEMIQQGHDLLRRQPVDFLLAVGGGSSMDTAKALSFTAKMKKIDWQGLFHRLDSPFETKEPLIGSPLPLLAIPTTSGTGSQVTQAAVLTHEGEKRTIYHPELFAKVAILDPTLLTGMPLKLTAMSGFDALTHAYESFISPRSNFLGQQDSIRALQTIFETLPHVLREPDDLDLRMKMSLADTLAGRALANGGAEAPHPLSELIGSLTHIPHGQALAVVYPAYLRKSREKFAEKQAVIFELMKQHLPFLRDEENLAEAMTSFLKQIGLPISLQELGVEEEKFRRMLQHPMLDHLPFGDGSYLRAILQEAYSGQAH